MQLTIRHYVSDARCRQWISRQSRLVLVDRYCQCLVKVVGLEGCIAGSLSNDPAMNDLVTSVTSTPLEHVNSVTSREFTCTS